MSFFVREHFEANRDAPFNIKIDAEPGFAWQRSHRTQSEALKPLLEVFNLPLRNSPLQAFNKILNFVYRA